MLHPEYQCGREQCQAERRARVMARLSMRIYRRELGGYHARDLTGGLDGALFLMGRLQVAIAACDGPAASRLVEHVQEKIAMASLGAAILLDTGVPSTRCNS